jgi:hypothetical protein
MFSPLGKKDGPTIDYSVQFFPKGKTDGLFLFSNFFLVRKISSFPLSIFRKKRRFLQNAIYCKNANFEVLFEKKRRFSQKRQFWLKTSMFAKCQFLQ